MAVLLSLLALAMVATGAAAIVFGAPIIQVERGWTMVISGSVVASGGALLLGIALVAQRLGRIAREAVQMRDRLAQIEELTAMRVADGSGEPVRADLVPAPPVPPASFAPSGAARPEETVVGQYSSGGSSYVMYGDGSIRAELPSGPRRFGSITELRAFVASGG